MSSIRERGTDPYDRFNTDPCRYKHGGTDTSRAAWEKAKHGVVESQQIILDVLKKAPEGLTCKEISLILGKAMHKISGRITELWEQGIIQKSNQRRDGGRVLVLVDNAPLPSPMPTPAKPDRTTLKAEIQRLYDAGDSWSALKIAFHNNINLTMEGPEVCI
jgi:hypothetical protein